MKRTDLLFIITVIAIITTTTITLKILKNQTFIKRGKAFEIVKLYDEIIRLEEQKKNLEREAKYQEHLIIYKEKFIKELKEELKKYD